MGSDSTLSSQVQEGRACPSVLELPTVLLQMERSRRGQEQVGAGRPGVRQRAGRVPLHIPAPHLPAAPVGFGAAHRGRAGPLLATLGPILWSEGPGPARTEPAQQTPQQDR